jgi:uncharacterized coiled-coil protein SlyX
MAEVVLNWGNDRLTELESRVAVCAAAAAADNDMIVARR